MTDEERFSRARLKLTETDIQGAGIQQEGVLRAMRSVRRHVFVPRDCLDQAYENHPLPIGYGQTISQPYIVALMTELLDIKPAQKVLEIGTGSGYQAAILAELQAEIYSLEIVPELAFRASRLMEELGYTNVHVKHADGCFGWPEYAPFDAIIVTAAPEHIPTQLVGQLAEGGRMVIPIGPPGRYQSLWKVVKEQGVMKSHHMGGVAFVPFTGSGIAHERER